MTYPIEIAREEAEFLLMAYLVKSKDGLIDGRYLALDFQRILSLYYRDHSIYYNPFTSVLPDLEAKGWIKTWGMQSSFSISVELTFEGRIGYFSLRPTSHLIDLGILEWLPKLEQGKNNG